MTIGYIITMILGAAVLLGICIFIHELGHLLGGKMVGIKARVFSIGYGKGVFKKQIGDTTYQLTLIPFGGYCQFYGDDPSEERKGEPYEFLSAPPLKRIVPVVMGPLFNLFLGIILFFAMNMIGYDKETNRIIVLDDYKKAQQSAPATPAFKAGLKTGDRIIEINGNRVTDFFGVRGKVVFSHGKPLKVKAERGGKVLDFTVQPERYSEKDYYTIGVMPYGDKIVLKGIVKNSTAARVGLREYDEIRLLDGKAVKSPDEFVDYIRAHGGKEVSLTVFRSGKEMTVKAVPGVREEITVKQFEDPRFKGEKHDIVIRGEDKLGIIKKAIQDGKVKINGKPVKTFDEFKTVVAALRGKPATLENPGGVYSGVISYQKFGFLGGEPAIAPEMVHISYGVGEGFIRAFVEPYNFIVMNLKGIGMLISGDLDVRQNISGPILIAKIAGDTAYHKGLSQFILIMAQISIILMVMNLLPIPMVDGSYVVFFLLEAVRGKPINDKLMEKIQMVGMVMLILLGVFVIYNDIHKLIFGAW